MARRHVQQNDGRAPGGLYRQDLEGSKPSELPIEQPAVFDFMVNLKTAGALGLSIPATVLRRATELIQ